MRGLKQYVDIPERIKLKSHASRVRGLKQLDTNGDDVVFPSHASRVRGLKQPCVLIVIRPSGVARFTRAWIETTHAPPENIS